MNIDYVPLPVYEKLCRFNKQTAPNLIFYGAHGVGKKRTFNEWFGFPGATTVEHLPGSVEFQFQHDSQSIRWNAAHYVGGGQDMIIFQHYLRDYMRTYHIEGLMKYIVIYEADRLSAMFMKKLCYYLDKCYDNVRVVLFLHNESAIHPKIRSRFIYMRFGSPSIEVLDQIDRQMSKGETDGIRWLLYHFYGYVPIQNYIYYLVMSDLTMDHDEVFTELLTIMQVGRISGPIVDTVRDHFYLLMGKGFDTQFLLDWTCRMGIDVTTVESQQMAIIAVAAQIHSRPIEGSRDIIFLEAMFWNIVKCLHSS